MATETEDNWYEPPKWAKDSDYTKLLLTAKAKNDSIVKLPEILEKSQTFPREFPINTVQLHQLQKKFPQETLERNINSVYPIMHEKALYLCSMFLAHKQKFGNHIERDLYQNMSLIELIDRLLSKRAVLFVGARDQYILLDGSTGLRTWETVGTPEEKSPLILKNCLSYDEIKLSAFLSVSSYTVFLNDGNRQNCGKFETDRTKIQDGGIIIGLIGPRMEKNVMEQREIIKSRNQNIEQNGYGQFFAPTLQGLFMNFYNDISDNFENLKNSDYFKDESRFAKLNEDTFFDKLLYERRNSISFDTLLLEANERAKSANKMAFVHVVGIGLGVWKTYQGQDKIFMDGFTKRLEFLGKNLKHVSDVCFAYIRHHSAGKYKHLDQIPVESHPLGGITVHIINRQPHERLEIEHENKLLVVSYAWDGNALPGNEFWAGSLAGSSDPAAASSTQIAELHNPHINSEKVRGSNLKVATLNDGVLSFEDYRKKIEIKMSADV